VRTAQHHAAAFFSGFFPSRLDRVRRWELWSIPPRAWTFILAVQVLVGALVVLVLVRTHVDAVDATRAGLLVVLSTLYAETANRVDLLRRYLHLGGRGNGQGKVWSNPTSVWTFAAALLLPFGYAAVVVAVIYGHILLRSRRHRLARSFLIVLGCATTLLGTGTAVAVQELTGVRLSDGGPVTAVVVLLALLGYTIVSLAATATAAYLIRRPSTVRSVLPGVDAIGFEVATLLLGVVTAVFVLRGPWLIPAVFVLIAVLHRSTLVKDLEVAASTDTKTGLLNAGAWHQVAQRHLLRAQRQHTPAAVLMIDLDHFKWVNDEHGHVAGDLALRAVADCLKEELRGYDALGRFGGEEFIVLLDGVEQDAAMSIAVRLTQAIRALTPTPAGLDAPLSITASIGVASYPTNGTSLDALTRDADAALYVAKTAGRDCAHHHADGVTHTTR